MITTFYMLRRSMKVGDLVKICCNNHFLNGKCGTVVLNVDAGSIYGLCVLVGDKVYGFEEHEVEVIDESRRPCKV